MNEVLVVERVLCEAQCEPAIEERIQQQMLVSIGEAIAKEIGFDRFVTVQIVKEESILPRGPYFSDTKAIRMKARLREVDRIHQVMILPPDNWQHDLKEFLMTPWERIKRRLRRWWQG